MGRNTLSRACLFLLTTGLLVGLSGRAEAHHRDFTFLRDWFLPYAGENEIEMRMKYVESIKSFDQEFEYEYGVTDHFAIEPGIGFHQEPGEPFKMDAWDMELRFNFGEFAYNQVLLAMNLGYEDPNEEGEPSRGEVQAIFSYYTPRGEDISVNFNVGQELSGPKEKEGEMLLGYVCPLTRSTNVFSGWRGGFESMFDFNEHFMAAGPVLVYRVDKEVNALLTALLPLNHSDEQHTVLKFIVEYEFDGPKARD